jgi:hypothetical protein
MPLAEGSRRGFAQDEHVCTNTRLFIRNGHSLSGNGLEHPQQTIRNGENIGISV